MAIFGDNHWLEVIAGANGTVAAANTPAVISASTALASNANRRGFMIQNQGTNPLFVLFGNGASITVFHMVLRGGTGAKDGLGGSFTQFGGVVYTGEITVAGTSPSYTVTEL